MIRIIALLCFIVAPTLAATWSPGLRARFDVSGFGTTSFMHLPKSATEADDLGWTTAPRATNPAGLEILTLWCPPTDYAVCVFIDDTGYIAGLQIALDIDNLSGTVLDMEVQGFTKWTTEINRQVKSYWTAQQYYISAETLTISPVIRIASRDQATLLQDSAIWLSGFNGELYRLSTNVSDITSDDSDFTKQSCIPLMGQHYYYKMSTELTCASNTMFQWFPLVQSNQLIGLGFLTFGKINIPEGQTDWFEEPNRTAVEVIVPQGPECLYEWSETAGVITMHTYFIQHPFLVNCILQ